MRRCLIDGRPHEITYIDNESGHLCVKVYVRPLGSIVRGPHSCHSVPQALGRFRTNGHDYDFTVSQ